LRLISIGRKSLPIELEYVYFSLFSMLSSFRHQLLSYQIIRFDFTHYISDSICINLATV